MANFLPSLGRRKSVDFTEEEQELFTKIYRRERMRGQIRFRRSRKQSATTFIEVGLH